MKRIRNITHITVQKNKFHISFDKIPEVTTGTQNSLKIETKYPHGRTQVAPQQAPSPRKTTAKPHHQTNPRSRLKIPLLHRVIPIGAHFIILFSGQGTCPMSLLPMSRRNFLLASLPHPFTASTVTPSFVAMAFTGISKIM